MTYPLPAYIGAAMALARYGKIKDRQIKSHRRELPGAL
jgi:hypothetical protein